MFKINSDNISKIMFFISIILVAFGYGYKVHQNNIFPYYQIKKANAFRAELVAKIKGQKQWYYQPTNQTVNVTVYDKEAAFDAPTLFSCVGKDNYLFAKIIDMDGKIIQEWKIDWFEIWPNSTHITEIDIPKTRPGTHIQGIALLDNGDLVFNFSGLGLVRLDVCGKVVWRLPYRTHHSIHIDEEGFLWVPGDIHHRENVDKYPFLRPVFLEPTILKISPEGEIIKEISLPDLMIKNGYESLLVMSSQSKVDVNASGDLLHLNDVEPFPMDMEEGFFTRGDILLSMRNINTILVFNQTNMTIKYLKIGDFVRQHDPDFLDGNTISVYNNNNIKQIDDFMYSSITIHNVQNNDSQIYFKGTPQKPFFSDLMGRHQWLPNGNMLLTESSRGRAFEIDKNGRIVWEYYNIVEEGYVGIVEEATRISKSFTKEFFEQKKQECKNSK